MRILIDGQTLGTPELARGIGKVFLELLHRMVDGDVGNDWFLAVKDRAHFDHLKSSCRRNVVPIVLPELRASGEQTAWCRAYESQLQDVARNVGADIYWNPNPLMPNVHFPLGFSECPGVVTLHDLIPWMMPERYRAELGEALWRDYVERCGELGSKQWWSVCVSRATAEDLRRFYPNSEARLRVVHHASNYSRFWPYLQGDSLSDPRYILYVGGFDPRKNMDNALRAYAAFASTPARKDVRFRVVCAYDEKSRTRFLEAAQNLGVADRVELLGYVSDEELGYLFRGASVFFFPSLYEGFGLPVLDALACGVPVVAANTSSIPEIAGEHALYCDPSSIADMVRALDCAWADRNPLSQRRALAVQHARGFRWEDAVSKYMEVFKEASATPPQKRASSRIRKPRVAYLSPWPPQKGGVADYSYHVMPALLSRMDVTLFAENAEQCLRVPGLKIVSLEEYESCASSFDCAIYHLGNGLTHVGIYERAWRIPGVVVLHDYNIHPIFHHGFLGHAREALYEEAIKQYGADGEEAWNRFRNTGVRPEVWQFAMSDPIVGRSRASIVHSRWADDRLNCAARVVRVHHGAVPRPEVQGSDLSRLRGRLRMDEKFYWIGVFGFVNKHKRVDSVIKAAKILSLKGFPLRILIVGEVNDDQVNLTAIAEESDAVDLVRHEGYVSEELFLEFLAAVDVVCNLRYPTMGESSGSMFHCLASGKPIVLSDHGSFSEIPDRVAWKIDPLNQEAENLAVALEWLIRLPDARSGFAFNGRKFISSQATFEHVAECYYRTVKEVSSGDVVRGMGATPKPSATGKRGYSQ